MTAAIVKQAWRGGGSRTPEKPRLRRVQHIDGVERWMCLGDGLSAIAVTPKAAHALWKECMMENLRTEELVAKGWL